MEKIPLLKWLLQGIPECIVLLFLSCKLLNFKFDGKRKKHYLIFCGFVFAISAYLIRFLPITQGVHTVVLLAILSFLTIIVSKCKPQYGIISSTITIIILVIFETICVESLITIFHLDITSFKSNSFLFIFLGWPQIILLFLTGIFISKLYDIKQKAKLAKYI